LSLFKHISLPTILLLLACSITLVAQDWKAYPHTPDGSLISFPVDEGWHPDEVIEWWYIAGHLVGESSGTSYSFMLAYFYYPGDTFGIGYDGFRILNLSNDDTGVFHSETMPVLNYMDLATEQLHIDARLFNGVSEHWYHKEENGGTLIPFEYELSASADRASITLSAASQKRPLIPGDDGLFDQGASSYTYYYSLTAIDVEGSLSFEESSEDVSGTAWIDRQYGSFNPNAGEAYEWFYLQLSNGMDLNIWNLFTADKQVPDDPAYRHLSAYVDEDMQYTSHDFELERLSWAKMPGSENCYAQSWRLSSETNVLDITFSTLHHNSEVQLPFQFFEGPISASGTVNGNPVSGIGFAELVKIYEAPRIQIARPLKHWNENFPIQWMVENPDDGRPLLFDLSYSIDQGSSWIPISEGLSDTLFYWNNHPFVNGDSCLFQVEGYTSDLTLQGTTEVSTHTVYDDQYTAANMKAFAELRVYPNPVTNTLRIEWNDESLQGSEIADFEILDMMGRRVIQGSASNGKVDVSMLNNGVYMLILHTHSIAVKHKFIKE
jgi:predicted secreted hydrolase